MEGKGGWLTAQLLVKKELINFIDLSRFIENKKRK